MSIVRQQTESELEAIATEAFINTAEVTKVSPHSVNRGLIRGNVRAMKMALKDLALAVARLFPDLASDTLLDQVADDHGVAPRFAAAQSSTWVRVQGDPGTVYQEGVNTVSDSQGNIFDLQGDVTLGTVGYDYVKVRSQQAGSFTNVDPNTLVNISPIPSGHAGVTNEYMATGGRDAEDDDTFRQRIKEGPNALAQDTLSYLAQVFAKINPNVLRVIYQGTARSGKVVLGILTVNGIDLTDDELATLLEQGGTFLAISELAPIGTQSYGVELVNVTYGYIDVSFRMQLFTGASYGDVVKAQQAALSKYVDFRTWQTTDVVQFIDLINIVKRVAGVKQVPDNYFSPSTDQRFRPGVFPRFRSFQVYDLDGVSQVDQLGLVPGIFYPPQPNTSFAETVI